MAEDLITCPACGSDSLRKISKEYKVSEPYAQQKTMDLVAYHCDSCGSEGDFSGEADKVIETAIEESKLESIQSIIESFHSRGISMASLERALELPQRTLTKWNSGRVKPTNSAVALLRMIRTFPWLVDVADYRYDYDISQKIHIQNAVASLLRVTSFQETDVYQAGIITSSQSIFMYMYFEKDVEDATVSLKPFRVASSKTAQATLSLE